MELPQTIIRANRIKKVFDALKEISDEGLFLDEKLFLMDICDKFNCSERIAKEYIKIARNRLNQL